MKSLETKKREAEERSSYTRTPQQQLEVLDKRLGKGIGAKNERLRLLSKINSKNKIEKEEPEAEPEEKERKTKKQNKEEFRKRKNKKLGIR